MKVLITSGGTREDIDTVRSIVNHSTGLLGSIIADVFSDAGAEVVYLCGEAAVRPTLPVTEAVIRNTSQLAAELERLMAQAFDCVIHCMAVSDYRPKAVMTAGELTEGGLSEALHNAGKLPRGKIDSRDNILVMLERTPKVIDRIKAIQPDTFLVGFKLLSGATEDELLAAANKLIEDSGCDCVLANDLTGISNGRHEGILVDGTGVIGRAETKAGIARLILLHVTERLGG